MSLAIKNRVDQLYFYILDFGNNALMPLNMLPHTADYVTFDDDEKLVKFFRIISEEIKKRKGFWHNVWCRISMYTINVMKKR